MKLFKPNIIITFIYLITTDLYNLNRIKNYLLLIYRVILILLYIINSNSLDLLCDSFSLNYFILLMDSESEFLNMDSGGGGPYGPPGPSSPSGPQWTGPPAPRGPPGPPGPQWGGTPGPHGPSAPQSRDEWGGPSEGGGPSEQPGLSDTPGQPGPSGPHGPDGPDGSGLNPSNSTIISADNSNNKDEVFNGSLLPPHKYVAYRDRFSLHTTKPIEDYHPYKPKTIIYREDGLEYIYIFKNRSNTIKEVLVKFPDDSLVKYDKEARIYDLIRFHKYQINRDSNYLSTYFNRLSVNEERFRWRRGMEDF